MHTALYRSFRPETFDSVLGQEHIIKILKNQIGAETTVQSYLFCGTRGTGKTTTARLLAKGVNCLAEGERPCGECANCRSIKEGTFMDVIEIDAASNNGVENIRELRESVKYPPASGRCKVYIVDEVHMLSTGAFNALLKTLEEPPENVMFILATTEPQKLPATVLSRCLRLDFKRVPERILKDGMRVICESLGIEIDDGALGLVAANADGSVRDGLSLLDQCIASGSKQVSRADVLELLGTAGEEIFIEMTELVSGKDVADALVLLDRILADGKDVKQFIKDWIGHYRNLLMTKFIKRPEDLLNLSCENVERIRRQSGELELGAINDGILELSRTMAEAKWSTQPRVLLELCIVKLAVGITGQNPSVSTFGTGKAEAAATSGITSVVDDGQANGQVAQSRGGADKNPPGQRRPAASDIDVQRLWKKIFEEGEAVKGSFNLLRTGAELLEVNDQKFVIKASNSVIKRYAEENRGDLEMIMERHVGKRLQMECIEIDAAQSGEQRSIENLADSIGSKLGLNIEIQ